MKVIEYGNRNAAVVLIQPIGDHDLSYLENEISLIREKAKTDFRFIAFKVDDWNKDLSPWKAPAVFGKEDFGDGAYDTLNEIISLCNDKTKTYLIGGYSLAGLFALWASYQTDIFMGVAAASPSMWFHEFTEYMKENENRSDYVYLSLGNKEEKTRNPIMATVGDRMKTAYEILQEQGKDCVFEWNEGNHFKDADIRTAKGFLWVLDR
ncbi:MAG: esterase [Clostridia bacterium]|nr:esterase [Clostridia bacterium]